MTDKTPEVNPNTDIKKLSDKIGLLNDKKPLMTILGIILVIIVAYYFVWSRIKSKAEIYVKGFLGEIKYENLKVGGFPFSKNVKIKGLRFENDYDVADDNAIVIDEVNIKSFIFSNRYKVSAKGIKYLNDMTGEESQIIFNEEPRIEIAFYGDGRLKSLNYSDRGYRVNGPGGGVLYSSADSTLKVDSTRNKNTIDYGLLTGMKNMQNLAIFNAVEPVGDRELDSYFFDGDISASVTYGNGNIIEAYGMKINKLILSNTTRKTSISLTGDLAYGDGDRFTNGRLDLRIENYNEITNAFATSIRKLITADLQSGELAQDDYNLINATLNNILLTADRVSMQNPASTAADRSFTIERRRNESDYRINGNSLYTLFLTIFPLDQMMNETAQ